MVKALLDFFKIAGWAVRRYVILRRAFGKILRQAKAEHGFYWACLGKWIKAG
ncbi:MAG: hypothetical protein PHG02_08585 [Oscillospiraceae bacterium]|nr:hypothetical protein [Oscillospiraceae bacterium]